MGAVERQVSSVGRNSKTAGLFVAERDERIDAGGPARGLVAGENCGTKMGCTALIKVGSSLDKLE
jgi:hypothetical protein